MLRRGLALALGFYLLAAAWWVIASGFVQNDPDGPIELLHVACDPTRELWAELNAEFLAHHPAARGPRPVLIRMSHGSSGSQARAVIDGMEADVVSLALWPDTDALRKANRIAPGWENRLPNRSLPYVS
ncbi:MAG: sulfate transporter subunit, partial [Gemmataceae bacterium]